MDRGGRHRGAGQSVGTRVPDRSARPASGRARHGDTHGPGARHGSDPFGRADRGAPVQSSPKVGAMTLLRDAGSQPAGRPDISVVVCPYSRATKLPRSLEALSRQTVGERAEVIVVDDGSTDTTAQVARAYEVKLLRHAGNQGLAAARNTGVQASRAPIVAFTDDDCVPAPDWLELLLPAYERPEALAVGGTVNPLQTGSLLHPYISAVNPLAPQEPDLRRGYSVPHRPCRDAHPDA